MGGLIGGHSGGDINRGRGNANKLLCHILWKIHKNYSIHISSINGGNAANAITREANTTLYVKEENIDQVKDPMARAFRQFAELSGNDLKALAAVTAGLLEERSETMASPAQIKESLKKIKVPVMTVVGSSEFIPGDKTLIAQLVPDACHFQIQGKDHLTVVPDPKFHMVVKAFLNHVNRR
ncbi:unnamed protein product [marine sediment metagenome]|uniref:Peptidase M20 dimerisation domain-containing protein n=1 Tax=marine sediment metagenome TaxID=412755 RepID=X1ATA9_9ZZZZ